MRYLFFDIESPNGIPDTMCEFGYVITDENFNILDRNNLLINPEKKIKPIYRRRKLVIKLFYPYKRYYESPTFPYRYPAIRKLLTSKDTLIFGYSVSNDIAYIHFTSEKYKQEQFDYSVYDIQAIYKNLTKTNKNPSLEKISQLIPESERSEFSFHRADHDAATTMLILKRLVMNNNLNLMKLLNSNENYKISHQDFIYRLNKPKKKKHHHKKNKNASPLQQKWGDFYRSALDKLEISQGKLCTISKIIKETEEDLNAAIDLINANGYVPCDKIGMSNYLIVKDEEDEKRLISIFRHPYQGKIIKLH